MRQNRRTICFAHNNKCGMKLRSIAEHHPEAWLRATQKQLVHR